MNTNTTISLDDLRSHLARSTAFWGARGGERAGDQNAHIPAWEWVRLHGRYSPVWGWDHSQIPRSPIEVYHHEHTGGEWLTVSESVAVRSGSPMRAFDAVHGGTIP